MAFLAALVAGVLALTWTGTWDASLWWLTNDAPPAIRVTVPDGPRRADVTLPVSINAGRGDRSGIWARLADVTVDGAAPPEGAVTWRSAPVPADGALGAVAEWWQIIRGVGEQPDQDVTIHTQRLADGEHEIALRAVDRSRRHNAGGSTVRLVVDNTPPQLALAPDTPRLRAGRPLLLKASASEAAALELRWGDEVVPVLPAPAAGGGAAAWALVAVPVQSAAGESVALVHGRDLAGNEADARMAVPVDEVSLPRQLLVVPTELAGLATGPVATAEIAQLVTLTGNVRPERLWHGPFSTPVPPLAPRTTGFGERRDYADGYVTYHGGYDLAVPQGAPVAASADGVVVFAGQMQQRGNCIVVDHGWGVYTVYGHLSREDVQAGQPVTQGQVLGLVGTTGLSTGPHLHWEVRLRGTPVDPNSWVTLSGQLAG